MNELEIEVASVLEQALRTGTARDLQHKSARFSSFSSSPTVSMMHGRASLRGQHTANIYGRLLGKCGKSVFLCRTLSLRSVMTKARILQYGQFPIL